MCWDSFVAVKVVAVANIARAAVSSFDAAGVVAAVIVKLVELEWNP